MSTLHQFPYSLNKEPYTNVCFVSTYYPKRCPEHAQDYPSQAVLTLKNRVNSAAYHKALRYFTEILDPVLPTGPDVVLVAVPSSTPNRECGIDDIIRLLCLSNRRVCRNKTLLRHTQRDKKSTSNDRRIELERDTIKVIQGDDLRGKHVIIMDDVYTSGSSMEAALSFLQPYDPRYLEGLTLTRTKRGV